MTRRGAGLTCIVCLLLATPALHAEMEGDEYVSGTVIQSEAERETVRRRIEQARQAEAERAEARERQEAEERARQQALAAARNALRPPGAILTETHCGTCHEMEQVLAARHTWLGWTLTLARMRYINGAKIPADTATQIRDHLALTQPAGGMRPWLEYGMTLVVTLMLGLGLWRIWVRKKPRLANGSQ